MSEEQGVHYVPEDEQKALAPKAEEVTISKDEFVKLQEQLRIMSQAFQSQIAHPVQAPVPAQAVITADSNAAKPETSKEVVLEEVETSTLFKHNPWGIGNKVRVSKDYPQMQGGISWRGRVGTISKILKDPSGVKMVEVAFGEVQVPFIRPHPTKPGMSQKGYRIQKAVQTFDDSCLEPVYE